jgi:hypothetical protein
VLVPLPSRVEDSVFDQMPKMGSWFSGTRVQLLMAMMPTIDNNEKSFFIGQVGYVKFGTIRTSVCDDVLYKKWKIVAFGLGQ